MRKLLTMALTLAVLALSVNSAGAKDWKKVRIGVEGAYPPFSAVSKDGKLFGFDVDIANALCKQMGAKCTLVQQDWDGIIPSLLARKYDAIIASMSITEERKKKVDFYAQVLQYPCKVCAQKRIGNRDLKGRVEGQNSRRATGDNTR